MSVLSAGAIVLGIALEGFGTLNHLVYDTLLVGCSPASSEEVLLVEVPEDEWSTERLGQIVACAEVKQARLIGVLGVPGDWQADPGANESAVYGALTWNMDPGLPEPLHHAGLPAVTLPPEVSDLRRGLPLRVLRDGRPVPLIETAMAERLGIPLPKDGYRVDFKVPEDRFQRLQAARFTPELPAQIVKGKVILVAALRPGEPAVTSPRHRGDAALSVPLFHAAVLDSLLRGGIIRIAHPHLVLLVSLLPALSLCWMLRRFPGLGALRFLAAGTGLVLGATWLLLHVQHFWFPPAGMILLLGWAGLVSGVARQNTLQHAVHQALIGISGDIRKRPEQDGLLSCVTPVPHVSHLLKSCFAFEPNVLLVRSGDGDGLRVVGGEFNQGAKPFALSLNAPELVSARREGHVRLDSGLNILPLHEGREAHAYWVFGQNGEGEVLDEARQFARVLGAMLDHRKRWIESALPQSASGDGRKMQPLHEQLAHSVDLIENSRARLMQALDRSREAVLLFDGLGRLYHASPSSLQLLADAGGFELEGSDPASLLCALTSVPGAEVRQSLRYVMTRREEATLMVSGDFIEGRDFLAHIRPLTGEIPGADTHSDLPGILVLIEDITRLNRASLHKDEFVERLYFQLNNDFESIVAASGLLTDTRLAAGQKAELVDLISEKVAASGAMMQETRKHLKEGYSPQPVACYPIRFEPVLAAARARVAQQAGARQVVVDSQVTGYSRLVLAASQPLEELLQAILEILIEDARKGERVEITAVESPDALTLGLANRGHGMPQEILDRYLAADADHEAAYQKVVRAMAAVAQWEGGLSARSAVGEGIRFELNLKCVM